MLDCCQRLDVAVGHDHEHAKQREDVMIHSLHHCRHEGEDGLCKLQSIGCRDHDEGRLFVCLFHGQDGWKEGQGNVADTRVEVG